MILVQHKTLISFDYKAYEEVTFKRLLVGIKKRCTFQTDRFYIRIPSCYNLIIQNIKFKRKTVKFTKYKRIAVKLSRIRKFPNDFNIRQEK